MATILENHTGNSGVATAVAGAATLNAVSGLVTSEALVTASGADYVLTLTNPLVTVNSIVVGSCFYGTANAGSPVFTRATCTAGQVVIVIRNLGAAALNGTIVIAFAVLCG